MKIYKFSGDGVALGAQIVVVSDRKSSALAAAKRWAAENNVPPDSLELQEPPVHVESTTFVAFGWNGDY